MTSKKEGKDEESIQSSTTPDPGYQWECDTFILSSDVYQGLVCIKDPNSIMFVSFRIANCAVYIKECRIERMLCLYMYVLNHLF